MSYSQADEYDRRMHAREIEYQRRVDAVVVDPAEQETEYIVECAKSLIVDREMAAEAVCRRFQALGRKECLERGAIGLGGPAAKVLDEELTHLFHYSGADLQRSEEH